MTAADRIRELWRGGERDIDRIAYEADASPEFARLTIAADGAAGGARRRRWVPPKPPAPPKEVRAFTAAEVAELRRRFAARPPDVTVWDWMVAEGKRLGLSHSTIRRAVYGFGAYAPAEESADTCHP